MLLADAVDALLRWSEHLEATAGVPPGSLAAALVLLVGVVAAIALRALVRRLVTRLTGLLPGRAREKALGEVVGRRDTAKIAGRVVFWLTIVLVLIAAMETLGLPVVTAWPEEVAAYVPRGVAAILVVLVGIVVGRLTRNGISRAVPETVALGAARLGHLVEIGIIGAAGLIAVEQLGIDITFLTTLVLLVVGALVAGAALAFGLGGGPMVTHILAAHYVRQLYEVGQHVRVDEVEGRIVRITQTAVILHSDEGQVVVPASTFATRRSTRLVEEA
jgi:hypothetical protein